MAGEELRLEREAEHPVDADRTSVVDQAIDDEPPDAMAAGVFGDSHRAYLRDVLPEHMEGAAPDDLAVQLGDDELLQALVVGDGILGDEDATLGVRSDEIADRADISCSRGSQRHGHAGHRTGSAPADAALAAHVHPLHAIRWRHGRG